MIFEMLLRCFHFFADAFHFDYLRHYAAAVAALMLSLHAFDLIFFAIFDLLFSRHITPRHFLYLMPPRRHAVRRAMAMPLFDAAMMLIIIYAEIFTPMPDDYAFFATLFTMMPIISRADATPP